MVDKVEKVEKVETVEEVEKVEKSVAHCCALPRWGRIGRSLLSEAPSGPDWPCSCESFTLPMGCGCGLHRRVDWDSESNAAESDDTDTDGQHFKPSWLADCRCLNMGRGG